MSWYILVLILSAINYPSFYEMLLNDPRQLFFNPVVIYVVTSSLIVLIILIIALYTLAKGSTVTYYLALVFIILDLIFGVLYQVPELIFAYEGKLIIFLLYILLPTVFKSAVIWSFVSNINKYKQFVLQKALDRSKANAEIVDI